MSGSGVNGLSMRSSCKEARREKNLGLNGMDRWRGTDGRTDRSFYIFLGFLFTSVAVNDHKGQRQLQPLEESGNPPFPILFTQC